MLTGPVGRGDLSPGPWAFYEALSGQDRLDQSIGVVSPRKTEDGSILVASTHTHAEHAALRPWDSSDQIHLSDPELARLDFRPDLVAAFGSVQFVYLHPTPEPLAR